MEKGQEHWVLFKEMFFLEHFPILGGWARGDFSEKPLETELGCWTWRLQNHQNQFATEAR